MIVAVIRPTRLRLSNVQLRRSHLTAHEFMVCPGPTDEFRPERRSTGAERLTKRSGLQVDPAPFTQDSAGFRGVRLPVVHVFATLVNDQRRENPVG